jgi:uncharacterized protein YbjT (DUF2867 family)
MVQFATTRNVATVFGGSGFIGRYVVQRLADRGYVVRAAVRDPESALFLKPMGAVGQIVPLYTSIIIEGTVQRAVEGAELVVNLVGTLSERKAGDFERVHAEGAARVARLAAAAGVTRLVHVSAIGAEPASASQYARTKAAGEASVRDAFPRATILRPSVVFGPEDRFLNRIGAMAQYFPIMPVIAGETLFQPVYVGDVADAVMAGFLKPGRGGDLYELGGPRVLSFRDLIRFVLQQIQRHRPLVTIPRSLARLQARFMELLPGKPLTRDQLLLLARDNVVAPGTPDLSTLGIVPTPLELVAPTYLRRFRPGGGKRQVLPEELKGTKADLPP